MPKPLDGLKVLSMAEQYPGPYATLLLADLGADVILIERPGMGDPARQFPSFFAALNRNKRSVAIDLKSDSGRDALKRLVETADIFLEGFRPGTMKRLGLDYESLSALNPRLIYASISGFGQEGPYRDRPAHDLSYQGMAGFLFRDAETGIPPERAPDVAVGDLSSGMFAAVGVLSAVIQRASTGRGCFIDVAMTDGLVSWMSVYLGAVLNGETPADIGAEPAYRSYACGDGKLITLSIAHEDWFWDPFCKVVGLDDAIGLKRPDRVARTKELSARIDAALKAKPRDEWGALFDTNGVPWGPVLSLKEVTEDPNFRARNLFREVAGERHVAQPLTFDGDHPGPERPTPKLGEHTDEVLSQAGIARETA